MHSSKTKKFFALILLILMLIVTERIFGYLLTPVSYADYYNYDIQDIKDKKENVSMIFAGASRTYRTFVPSIFEETLGIDKVINAGSSSQPISATYYQTKELVKEFHPKYVVIGVTYDQLISEESTQGKLIVYDRLKNPFIKTEFALNCFKGTEKLYLLNSYRFRDNLSIENMKQYINDKQELKNSGYSVDKQANEYYADNGFVYSNRFYENGNIAIEGEGKFNYSDIKIDSLKYMDKIVELCEKNDITLYLVTGPTTMMRIYNTENYQEADEFYHEYAEQKGIVYHNLNLIKDRENILPDSLMHDYNHVNGKGAEVISRLYAEILKESIKGKNTDGYFYSSLQEMKKDVNRVVAVGADISVKNGEAIIKCNSLQNEEIIPEYQILLSEDGANYNIITDYTIETQQKINIPQNRNYKIRINARCKGSENSYDAFQEYSYIN